MEMNFYEMLEALKVECLVNAKAMATATEQNKELKAEVDRLRRVAKVIGHDCHMEGRVYSGGGEIRNPSDEFERIDKRIDSLLDAPFREGF